MSLEKEPPWKKHDKKINQATTRDKEFALDLVQHPEKPLKQRAKEHGMSVYQAEQKLQTPPIRGYVMALMAQQGAKAEKAMKVLAEAMDATKFSRVFSKGKFSDMREEPDWQVRTRAAELVLRIHGMIGNLREDGGGKDSLGELVDIIKKERKRRGLDE